MCEAGKNALSFLDWLAVRGRYYVRSLRARPTPLFSLFLALSLLLITAGDVETNPGPISDDFLARVDDSELTDMDIHEVCDAVHTLSARWSDLCFALKLPPADEEIIAESYRGNPRRCLREVLLKWLRKNYKFEKYGHPSWRFLVRAVGDPNGGNDCALAETIGKKHTGLLSREGEMSSIPQAPSVGLVPNRPRMAPMRSRGREIRRGLSQAPGVRGAHGPRMAQMSDGDIITLEENRSETPPSCCGCLSRFRRPTYTIQTQNSSQHPGMASSQPPQHQAQIAVDSETNETHFEEQCMPEHPEEANRRVRCYYANLLRDKYRGGIPTILSLQWPPLPTKKVFNLAMVTQERLRYGSNEEVVTLLLRGDVKGATDGKDKMTLERISASLHPRGHHSGGRKIFLIEGAPGAGKSTMAWHMCLMWVMGKLFEEFEIVLFVQLRDPAIQSAHSLDDLFPDDLNMKSEVVHAIQHCGGHNMLIVLDGWDEFPPGLDKNSIISKLIRDPSSLKMQFSALIITSRPIATARLQHFATSRIEIVGFMRTEIEGYFAEVVGNLETEKKLKDRLKERPVIEACCYLPMNAAIIAHVFLASNYTLPTTLHGVFVSLILCCIKRHLTKQPGEEISISSLNDLPADIGKQLEALSTLAYHGVRESKVTFSTADLKRYHLPTELSTLSLIQGVESFTVLTKSKSYNFLHLSVQELLAAFHISKISPEEQVKIFNELFEKPRFSAVFQFYAAFTKLETEGVRDVVARIVRRGSKLLLLTLLRCLYETRDESLCKFVAAQLNGEFSLSQVSISPVDCLSVGYFLKSVCLATSQEIKVNLSECRLNHYLISLLCKELSEGSGSSGIPGVGVGQLHIFLFDNQLGDEGAIAIASCLKKNQTLKTLDLGYNSIGDVGATSLGDALGVNHSLETLSLGNNDIRDVGATSLGDALRVNHSLETLKLWTNRISHEKKQELFWEFASRIHC